MTVASPPAPAAVADVVEEAPRRPAPPRPLVLLLVAYVATTLVVPVLAPVAVGDDWVYSRAAFDLYRRGELRILEPATAVSVFEAGWGALFSLLFGFSFGVLRLSSVVLTALGSIGVFGLASALGARRHTATVAAAAYLFNPLNFVLSFTYMTDPHFTALAALSGWCYVRGLRTDAPSTRFVVAGSAFASLALLSRHHGVLLPAAVVLHLLVSRRVRWSRSSVALLATVLVLPLATTIGYVVWLTSVRGVTDGQEMFTSNIVAAGPSEIVLLFARHAFIQPVYLAAFLLPLVPVVLLNVRRIVRAVRPSSVALAAPAVLGLLLGLVAFQTSRRRMPYLASYFGRLGLGPYDLVVPPAPIVPDIAMEVFTVACFLGVAALVLLAMTWLAATPGPDRSGAALTALFLLMMGVGAIPPSVTFRNANIAGANVPGLDRYLLPMLPFAVALFFAAVSRLRLRWEPVLLGLVPFAVFATMSTRDSLVFQSTVWSEARLANSLGVPNVKLDAGAAWSGHYLYEYSYDNNIPVQTVNGPWWTVYFAPATDSSYTIGTSPPPGWTVVHERSYSSWLQTAPTKMFLLRRPDVPGPP